MITFEDLFGALPQQDKDEVTTRTEDLVAEEAALILLRRIRWSRMNSLTLFKNGLDDTQVEEALKTLCVKAGVNFSTLGENIRCHE